MSDKSTFNLSGAYPCFPVEINSKPVDRWVQEGRLVHVSKYQNDKKEHMDGPGLEVERKGRHGQMEKSFLFLPH